MTNFARIARRTTWILFSVQSLASAGFSTAGILTSILGAELAGSAVWAGLPSAVYLLAGAFAALVWGRLMDVIGRRGGIASGLLIGALGSMLALVAVTAMVIGQVSMVAVMVVTSLHMHDHNHASEPISWVFLAHTTGMFAFSVFSGRLAERRGRGPVILGGAGILFLACITAPLSPQVVPLAVSLFLLGLGWNFCFVGGSTLLSDQLAPAERSRTQGFNDLLVGLASAIGSLASGFVYAATSYTAIALLAGVLALIPLAMVLAWMRRQPARAAAG